MLYSCCKLVNNTEWPIKKEHEHIACNLNKYQPILIIFISIYSKMNLLHYLRVSLRSAGSLPFKLKMTAMRINAL